jgi:hypothetical protein
MNDYRAIRIINSVVGTVLIVVVALASTLPSQASDKTLVQVVATHQATHNDRSTGSRMEALFGRDSYVGKQREVFNLDTVIGSQNVILLCVDDKGCEAPPLGTFDAKVNHGHYYLTFPVMGTTKTVTRAYQSGGSWRAQ